MNRYFCVIGSITYRITTTSDNFAIEKVATLTDDYITGYGGRGANQAATLAKLGGTVNLIGKIGNDLFGSEYLKALKDLGVSTKFIEIDKNHPTGLRLVSYKKGYQESKTLLSLGANLEVTPEYLEKQSSAFQGTSVFLLPGELKLDTMYFAKKKIQSHNKTMLFAPCLHLVPPFEFLKGIDFLTPTYANVKQITDIDVIDDKSALEASKFLLDKGVKHVVIKAKDGGVYYANKLEAFYCEGYDNVEVIDPTASDEAFNAALGFALSNTGYIREAIVFAQAVKSYVSSKVGAVASLPSYEQAEKHHRSKVLNIREL